MDVIENIGKDPDRGIVANGPHLHDYLQEMNERTFGPRGGLAIGECWNSNNDNRILYLDPKRKELSMVFQFDQITAFWDEKYGKWFRKPFDLRTLKERIFAHESKDQDVAWNTLFWENHDLPRSVSIYSQPPYRKEAAKLLFAINAFLKGTPFIYQGEELGMENGELQISDLEDIESKNIFQVLSNDCTLNQEDVKRRILEISRDNARTPMQWDHSSTAGFSAAAKTWLPTNPNKETINVKDEEQDKSSILNFYKTLIQLRLKDPVLSFGDFEPVATKGTIAAYYRGYDGHLDFVLLNLTNRKQRLPKSIRSMRGKVLLSNYYGAGFAYKRFLRPYESMIVSIK